MTQSTFSGSDEEPQKLSEIMPTEVARKAIRAAKKELGIEGQDKEIFARADEILKTVRRLLPEAYQDVIPNFGKEPLPMTRDLMLILHETVNIRKNSRGNKGIVEAYGR